MLKILCSFLLMVVILGISMNKAEAHSSASISADEGFSSYNGWVMADMTINESGIVTPDASYSMRIYTAMGLVPVAYCASGGSHMGTYYTFFVNPQTGYLMVDRIGPASHGMVFSSPDLKAFSKTGHLVNVTDMSPQRELYRKAISVAKTEFDKYQSMIKK
ncbi:hypothetical protein [Phascolarctobacterium succinatutens]|uniref:hypothetical protein n=1 Tax=Phascolarctobacterium succinatutens TaxID=626940 RepID=UPI0026EED975|nr:hypothetical protein [Phascolarctobacterium succinatutens]